MTYGFHSENASSSPHDENFWFASSPLHAARRGSRHRLTLRRQTGRRPPDLGYRPYGRRPAPGTPDSAPAVSSAPCSRGPGQPRPPREAPGSSPDRRPAQRLPRAATCRRARRSRDGCRDACDTRPAAARYRRSTAGSSRWRRSAPPASPRCGSARERAQGPRRANRPEPQTGPAPDLRHPPRETLAIRSPRERSSKTSAASFHLSCIICHLPSVLYHLPSVICHPPSAIRHPPFWLSYLVPRDYPPRVRGASSTTFPLSVRLESIDEPFESP